VVAGVLAAVVLVGCQLPPMGGQTSTLGNDPTQAGIQADFWDAIAGPYSARADGDPFSTKCQVNNATATSCDTSGANPHYSPAGYTYLVDLSADDVGKPVSVAVYDPAFSAGDATGDSTGSDADPTGFATSYELFQTTGSGDPGAISTDPSNSMAGQCQAGPGRAVFDPGTEDVGTWSTLCTFIPASAGLYPLVVRTSGIPGLADRGGGSNDFALRATTPTGAQPSVVAYDDWPVTLASSGSGSALYLTEIGPQYAGQTLQVDLFDPGEATLPPGDDARIRVEAPPGGIPGVAPTGGSAINCSYSAPMAAESSTPTFTDASPCTVPVASGGAAGYDGQWLRIVVHLPVNYSCSSDCWWSLWESISGGSGTPSLDDPMTISTIVH
jgi:hypothetical protein